MKVQDIFLEFRNFRMGKYLQLMFFHPMIFDVTYLLKQQRKLLLRHCFSSTSRYRTVNQLTNSGRQIR